MTGAMGLVWPDCLNVRDLGGLPTNEGRRIRLRALIRSDNLTRLTEAGVAAVRKTAVSRIVDLRTELECAGDPSPFAAESLYHNLPLSRDGDPDDPALSLGEQYTVMFDLNPDLFAAAVGAIADAPDGCVVVHCHAGKDRAGVVVALALGVVGVPADSVAADYAVLDDRMHRHFSDQLALVEDERARSQLAESFTARPETMLAALMHLEDKYGGIHGYLRYGGLSSLQVDALRARLVH